MPTRVVISTFTIAMKMNAWTTLGSAWPPYPRGDEDEGHHTAGE